MPSCACGPQGAGKIHELYHQTFVYVTHDQIEAMTVGHRIALMNQGKLQMLDTPSNVYNRPANVFTAKFIGSPSMNITESTYMDGQLKIDGQRIELPDMWKELAARQSSNRLYFGIRPEHVKLSTERLDNALAGTVKYVEDYGNRFGAYVDVGGVEFIAVGEERCLLPERRCTSARILNGSICLIMRARNPLDIPAV